MNIFKVKETVHGSMGIELFNGNPQHHELLRRMSTVQFMDHPAYAIRQAAGAFLQGQDDSYEREWTLIEFWKENYQPFVDFLNKKIEEEIQNV